jgi:hypothetical protein
MKKTFAALVAMALIGLGLPTPLSAAQFTYVCDPSTQPPPPDWFGGPYLRRVKVVVDTANNTVELFAVDDNSLTGTMPPARLSGLNNFKLDVTLTDNQISWGIIEMWGFSGYIDRRSGRLDAIWTNHSGFDASTITRQFHGTCRER